MRTYKTWEMIKMLTENPKLRYKSQNGYIASIEQKSGLFVWQHPQGTSGISHNLRLLSSANGDCEADNWQLVREPVPWQEALQAWASGKTIKCVINKCDAHPHIFDNFHLKSSMPCPCTRDMIKDGKWYIEDTVHE